MSFTKFNFQSINEKQQEVPDLRFKVEVCFGKAEKKRLLKSFVDASTVAVAESAQKASDCKQLRWQAFWQS